MKSFYVPPFLLIIFILLSGVINGQTIKKDPQSNKYFIQGNTKLPTAFNKSSNPRFDDKKFNQQRSRQKKIINLHNTFEKMRQAEQHADSILLLNKKIKAPKLETVKILGKSIPIYKAPFIPKPVASNYAASSLVSNVLINGKSRDTISKGDPFYITFAFQPGSITAAVNVYVDSDNNGIVSPGDQLLSYGLLMDNSEYDYDLAEGTYKMIFEKDAVFSFFSSTLIFEINDYASVGSAVMNVRTNNSTSLILGSLNVPLANVMIFIMNSDYYSNVIEYAFTDSLGKFSVNIDTLLTKNVQIIPYDIFGVCNGYIPPEYKSLQIKSDTIYVQLDFQPAKSFIEGHVKDQYNNSANNIKVSVEGPVYGNREFQVITRTDSSGYYKLGVIPGQWRINIDISESSNYMYKSYSYNLLTVNQDETLINDIYLIKANNQITGKVTLDAKGIQGIPVYAITDSLSNSIITSEYGNYSLPVFGSGTENFYAVYISLPGGYYNISGGRVGILPGAENVDFEFIKIKGGLTGKVTDINSGDPIPDAYIYFSGIHGQSTSTDESGNYRISLLDGIYSVTIIAEEYHNFNEDYILVSGSVINKDFKLLRSGTFSGTIKDGNGNPIRGASVYALDSLQLLSTGYSGIDGNYIVSGLSTVNCKAYARINGYITQWYNNVSTSDSASVISVVDGYNTAGINFVLSKGGSISGKVVDKFGKGIENLMVEAFDPNITNGSYGFTDTAGVYIISGLITGKYYVYVYSTDYINQYYDGVTEIDKAKLIDVTINQNTPDINFTLALGSSISGFVKDKKGNGIFANIALMDSVFNIIQYSYSDNSGQYIMKPLQPGITYYILAEALGYQRRWYNNVSTADSATPIILLPEEIRNGINFQLPAGGVIMGSVFDAFGNPLPYININLKDTLTSTDYWYYTNSDGSYYCQGLASGSYFISAQGMDYLPQWYDHKNSFEEADLLKVEADQVLENINFNLLKPVGDSIIFRIKLDKLTDTLKFNASHVEDGYLEYWLGICIDADGSNYTGTNGCEVEAALVHINYGDPEFISNILAGTEHVLLYFDSFTSHQNLDVKIDPKDKNSLVIAVPKFWPEINPITSSSKFYAHSYYYSPDGIVQDYTNWGKDMITIQDPAGDIKYSFMDIVSAGWEKKNINAILPVMELPTVYAMEQNYPNPFNPNTTIKYSLPYSSNVKIEVYNILGQKVRQLINGVKPAGTYEVIFDAANLSSGVYFYTITASSTSNNQEFKGIKKMIMLK